MTAKELNRDIKRLGKLINTEKEYNEQLLFAHEKEFKRLYNADREFKYMNAESIRIMLRINLRHRIIPLHQFGLDIEL